MVHAPFEHFMSELQSRIVVNMELVRLNQAIAPRPAPAPPLIPSLYSVLEQQSDDVPTTHILAVNNLYRASPFRIVATATTFLEAKRYAERHIRYLEWLTRRVPGSWPIGQYGPQWDGDKAIPGEAPLAGVNDEGVDVSTPAPETDDGSGEDGDGDADEGDEASEDQNSDDNEHQNGNGCEDGQETEDDQENQDSEGGNLQGFQSFEGYTPQVLRAMLQHYESTYRFTHINPSWYNNLPYWTVGWAGYTNVRIQEHAVVSRAEEMSLLTPMIGRPHAQYGIARTATLENK